MARTTTTKINEIYADLDRAGKLATRMQNQSMADNVKEMRHELSSKEDDFLLSTPDDFKITDVYVTDFVTDKGDLITRSMKLTNDVNVFYCRLFCMN